jgi:hypothetical protein
MKSVLFSSIVLVAAVNGASIEPRQFPGMPVNALGPISAAMGKFIRLFVQVLTALRAWWKSSWRWSWRYL